MITLKIIHYKTISLVNNLINYLYSLINYLYVDRKIQFLLYRKIKLNHKLISQ